MTALPICFNVASTPGVMIDASPKAIAGANKITTIKSKPSGTFFSIHLIKSYAIAAMNAGNNLKSCNTKPTMTANTGATPKFKHVRIPTAIPLKLPAKSQYLVEI